MSTTRDPRLLSEGMFHIDLNIRESMRLMISDLTSVFVLVTMLKVLLRGTEP